MHLKRGLVILFWFVAIIAATYLRTAIYTSVSTLLISSGIDLIFLFALSVCVYFYLKKRESDSLFRKIIVLLFLVLITTTCRYISESYFMDFGLNFDSEVAVKFVFTKLMTSFIIGGLTLGFYIWEKYLEVQQEKLRAEMEQKQLELDFMKSRVNPHFLFNTLGSIHSLALVQSDQTAPMIEELSSLMRYMFYDCQNKFVSLTQEIRFIENYIQLNQLKSQKPLSVRFDFSQEDPNFELEPLLFISFIENAFKHGNIQRGGFINLKIKQSGLQVEFNCENSFDSEDIQSQADRQSGFGMANIKKRLEFLYPEAHQLTIENTDIFKVHLILRKNNV